MWFLPGWIYTILAWLVRLALRLFGSLRNQLFAVKTYLIATFFIGFTQLALALTKKVLLALGIGFVTYQLGSYSLDYIFDMLQGSLSDLPSDALIFLKLAKVDEAISIIFGAISARLTLMGVNVSSLRQSKKFYA